MLVLGVMMMFPALAMYYYSGQFDVIFVKSGIIAIFIGGGFFLSNYSKLEKISILQGYLITICSWFITPLICALPFLHHAGIDNIHDAIFEATAGITTTGATILTDVEVQPKSILLWRAMLNGLGGIGIIIFAVALSPFLGIGGMNLFTKENSDTEEKFLPKISYIAHDIILVYICLNVLCAVLLKYFGMNWFDAVTWAMATLSTGGFSTKNSSIAFYDSAFIELIIGVFMLLGALPITYFILIIKKKSLSYFVNNSQVNTFIKLIVFYIAVLTVFFAYQQDVSMARAFRLVSFNLIATITTSGIYSDNFVKWGPWAICAFFILFLHGGCTGSTTGSIKIFRWQVVTSFLKKHIAQSLSPNQVTVMKVGDKVVSDSIASSVFALVLSFMFAIIFFTLVLTITGIDFMTSLGAVMGNITGVGCGLTTDIGPNSNFSQFTPFVKYVLSFVMILGRLEVITIVVLLGKIKFH